MPRIDYPWFEVVEGSRVVLQGDLFSECPVVEVPQAYNAHGTISVNVKQFNVVVLTQSCDIINDKAKFVLVCPIFPIDKLLTDEKRGTYYSSDHGKASLKRGGEPAFHVIASSDHQGLKRPVQFADFRSVYGVSREILRGLVEAQSPRLRMPPPYREHLAQAFARYIMRIALPNVVDFP